MDLLRSGMASSPPRRCRRCLGVGRTLSVHVQPASAGIPEQVRLDGRSAALWYPDGSTGVVRHGACLACDSTGLAPRRGPSDVRAMEAWMRRTGVELAEPMTSVTRGFILRGGKRLEVDQASGELIVSCTTSPGKAITPIAMC